MNNINKGVIDYIRDKIIIMISNNNNIENEMNYRSIAINNYIIKAFLRIIYIHINIL